MPCDMLITSAMGPVGIIFIAFSNNLLFNFLLDKKNCGSIKIQDILHTIYNDSYYTKEEDTGAQKKLTRKKTSVFKDRGAVKHLRIFQKHPIITLLYLVVDFTRNSYYYTCTVVHVHSC